MRPAVLCLVLAGTLNACDLPTGFPRYDTQWNVVAVRDSISTRDLLPKELRVTPDGFFIDFHSFEGDVRLSEVCELCSCFTGPLEPFEITPRDWRLSLPFGLISATIERGTARIILLNELGFDLLDDGQGGRGFLVVDIVDLRDGVSQRQAIVVQPFPPGDSLRLSFDLSGLVLSQYLVARVRGYLPGSPCPLALTPDSGFRTRVELEGVLASSVEVWLSDAALRLPSRSLDIPNFLANRLRSGEANLTVEVEVETRLPADVEIGLSAAGQFADLFSERAALYTPLIIPGAPQSDPRSIKRFYVVQLGRLSGVDRLYLDTRNRFLHPRPMVIRGGESVVYQLRLRAEIPVR